ncbi:Peroxidasin-like protein [Amphibalanus amphitrite]|uniref:Peroxidasin-like protein n=1 Tax=Amphibalanus amphitrite TaxID=1232801 RepID=A0A6A4VNL3_AMPAM|nr:Peroxidasin-like protein [Amphibalanus amphitrite]
MQDVSSASGGIIDVFVEDRAPAPPSADGETAPPPADDCMPFASVPGLVGRMMAGQAPATCSFADGSVGVSAGRTPSPPAATGPPLEPRTPLAPLPLPVGADQHLASAVRQLDAMVRLERRLSEQAPLAPERLHTLHFRSDAASQHQGRRALRDLMVVQLASNSSTRAASATTTTTTTQSRSGNGRTMRVTVRKTMVGEKRVPGCEIEPEISCDRSNKYRTADGSCNNLKTPSLGRSGTGLHRLLNSTFSDGIFGPRLLGSGGSPLPSARRLSASLLSTNANADGRVAVSLPVFAEFLSHDLQQTGVFRLEGDRPLDCCAADSHPQCLPISVSGEDPVFSAAGRRCISMTRSLPAPERQCLPRSAAPLSRQTAFLDGSGLYGANAADTRRLRELRGGRLRSNDGLLPTRDARDATAENTILSAVTSGRRRRDAFGRPSIGFPDNGLFPRHPFSAQFGGVLQPPLPGPLGSFNAPLVVPMGILKNGRFDNFGNGNHRANEQLHGALLHTVWLREHNRVADELARNHPDWDDERLFQEARRVVVAQLQHITYNEFVPGTLGYEYAATRGLLPLSVGFSPLYNASVDPRPAVEFSTAAFRAGHSKLQGMLRLVSRSGQVDNSKLTDGAFNPAPLVDEGFFVRLARGMIDQPAEGTDANFAAALHGEMLGGVDLPALTIQRGRDQGLATYPAAVQLCHGKTLASWNDFSTFMDAEAVEELRTAYADPSDVDLYIGGMMERHAEGADLGPTFQCLVGDMFYRLRVGDRFFYDNADQAGTFDDAQLNELRKASMARILCDNVGGDFDGVQPMAMLRPDERENPIVSCSSQALPRVNLGVF